MMLLKRLNTRLRSKILKIKYLIFTKTTLNAKIKEVKGKVPSITNLATTTTFTAFENKIPNVSNLIKKTDYKLIKLKRKLRIIIMINILLFQNLKS